ncbi:hypothetical protein ABZW10_15515 [Kitasatospora sp. NPDC004723]|uniref:hypothetical protein n=1 Tax=Kitasatospora sp. NPDC004723 TaxID=3154288 RepID=UPI0033A34140
MTPARLVTVEVAGLVPPTTYALLSKALSDLWAAVRFQPMSRPQWQQLECCLAGPGAERFVAERLDNDGVLELPAGEIRIRLRWVTP